MRDEHLSPDEFKRLFPNISQSCLRANAEDGRKLQSPKSKLPFLNEPVGEEKGKGQSANRFRVHLESRRSRLIDPDNLCGKFVLDSLRYAGAIPDDTAAHIEYSVIQTKVKKGHECTVITINQIQ